MWKCTQSDAQPLASPFLDVEPHRSEALRCVLVGAVLPEQADSTLASRRSAQRWRNRAGQPKASVRYSPFKPRQPTRPRIILCAPNSADLVRESPELAVVSLVGDLGAIY